MEIQRDLTQELIKWKTSPDRKPLILKGVRQCGKTWLLQNFGKTHFENIAYFNFEKQNSLSSLFAGTLAPGPILTQLSAVAGKRIEPQNTLIIFDEIQECPRALNSLKYFHEDAPEYAIVAAGSLLGITLSAPEGFPVGKVQFLTLHPCSFNEYLQAAAPMLADYCKKVSIEPLPRVFTESLETVLREYITLGGMPAVLCRYLESNDVHAADAVLDDIVTSYELDFSKHAPAKDIPKLFKLWKSIPEQLAHENAKFVYGEVRTGARAKDLEDALRWLVEAGIVQKIHNVKSPLLPLTAYEDRRKFKVYLSDTGVLRKLAGLSPAVIVNKTDLFGEFKGRLAENFALQQLRTAGLNPICYWTSEATAEVDFIIQDENAIVPVEIKSGLNLNARSLKVYREKYRPNISVRSSLQNLKTENGLLNIPLYLLGEIMRFLKSARG